MTVKRLILSVLGVVLLAGFLAGVVWLVVPKPPRELGDPLAVTRNDVEKALGLPKLYVIAVGSADEREIVAPGTRSEKARYTLVLGQSLFGETAKRVVAWRWTKDEKHFLAEGKPYLLVLSGPVSRVGSTPEFQLWKFESYTAARAAEVRQWIVEASRDR